MKILYFDCKNGISGDMLLKVLLELGSCREQVQAAMAAVRFSEEKAVHSQEAPDQEKQKAHSQDARNQEKQDKHTHDSPDREASGHEEHVHRHSHDHEHSHHGRSWVKVRDLIEGSGFSPKARETAIAIYSHIAAAEAKVHEATLETVHFHEVGRDEAIRNALGIGMALEIIAPDKIYTSEIFDGKGTILCSHGEIPVPVPAVQALMEHCSFTFRTADVDTEMVTPSGLAGLMGIGAEAAGVQELQSLQGAIILAETEASGSRATGRGGLKARLIKQPMNEQEETC